MTMITTKQIDQIVEDLMVLRRDIKTIEEAAARDPGVPGQQPTEGPDAEQVARQIADHEYIRQRLRHMERSGLPILDEEQFASPLLTEDDLTGKSVWLPAGPIDTSGARNFIGYKILDHKIHTTGKEWFKLNTTEPRWFTHDQLKRSGPIFFEDNREAP